jgi:hypothetical protein
VPIRSTHGHGEFLPLIVCLRRLGRFTARTTVFARAVVAAAVIANPIRTAAACFKQTPRSHN